MISGPHVSKDPKWVIDLRAAHSQAIARSMKAIPVFIIPVDGKVSKEEISKVPGAVSLRKLGSGKFAASLNLSILEDIIAGVRASGSKIQSIDTVAADFAINFVQPLETSA